jgi:hypothetical protein
MKNRYTKTNGVLQELSTSLTVACLDGRSKAELLEHGRPFQDSRTRQINLFRNFAKTLLFVSFVGLSANNTIGQKPTPEPVQPQHIQSFPFPDRYSPAKPPVTFGLH